MATQVSVPDSRSEWTTEKLNALRDSVVELQSIENTPLADSTLAAGAATFSLTGLTLTGRLCVTLIANIKLTGTHNPPYGHVYMTFNADATAGNYGWSVANSDNTYAISTANTETNMLVGHAPTTDATASNEFGTLILKILFPGDTNNVKNVSIKNQIITSFASYASNINPLEMTGGGFWKGPGAITSLTIIPEFNQIAAGSRLILLNG